MPRVRPDPFMSADPTVTENRLLSAFPAATREHLMARPQRARLRDSLFSYNEPIEDVFFPHRGTVISMTRGTPDGAMVEVSVAGTEGMAGLQAVLAPSRPRVDGVVQIEGSVTRVPISRLREALDDRETLDLVLAYTSVYVDLVTQNVVCNRLHSIEQRLAKWLLVMRDRAGTDRLMLTHEFLAQMLGVRRSGVSIAVAALTMDALIEHTRSQIVLRDVVGLEARCCECYAIIAGAIGAYEKRLSHS
jgi:CRP-like cAMP-binding protein